MVRDAQRHGVRVLGVDVNRSQPNCVIEDGVVRLGYRYVAGLGPVGCARWEEARRAGPFPNLESFCRRTRLPREVVADLIRVGAMDGWGVPHRNLLWKLSRLEYREGTVAWTWQEAPLSWASPTLQERLEAEYDVLGMGLEVNPIALYRSQLQQEGVLSSGELVDCQGGETVRVAGESIVRQSPPTAKGYNFITLEDEEGMINLVFEPRIVARYRAIMDAPLMVAEGVVQRTGNVVNIKVTQLWSVG